MDKGIITIKNQPTNSYTDSLLNGLFACGAVLCFRPCMPEGFGAFVIAAVALIAPRLFEVTEKSKKTAAAVAVLAVLYFVLCAKFIYHGALYALGALTAAWNAAREDALPVTGINTPLWEQWLFWIGAVFIICLLAWYIGKKSRIVIAEAVILLLFIFSGILALDNAAGFALLLTAWLGKWIVRVSGQLLPVWAAGLIITGAALFAAALAMPYGLTARVAKTRQAAEEAAYFIRYGKDSLPLGNLHRADKMLLGEEERLDIRSDYAKNMYLRGFVGERYTVEGWQKLPRRVYRNKNSGLFRWLSSNGCAPCFQFAAYADLCHDSRQYTSSRVNVENIGANRAFIYLTYSAESLITGSSREVNGNIVPSGIRGCSGYGFKEKSSGILSELIYNEDWVSSPVGKRQKEYSEAENVYRSFVYENYLDTDTEAAPLVYELVWNNEPIPNGTGIYEATDRIRKALSGYIYYTNAPSAVPEGEDGLMWCLTESGEGNAAFFASAAVFAYRQAGIPARYAEGYFVSDVRLANDGGHSILNTQSSHAWAEVYMDGAGWLPVDVTPGYYYTADVLKDMYKSPQGLIKTSANDNDNADIVQAEGSSAAGGRFSERLEAFFAKYGRAIGTAIAAAAAAAAVILLILYGYLLLGEAYIIKRLTETEPKARALLLFGMIKRRLKTAGINAAVGKDGEETDRLICAAFKNVRQGEYLRVHGLIEKVAYGEIPLKPYEMRTVYAFLGKLKAKRAKNKIGLLGLAAACVNELRFLTAALVSLGGSD